MKKIIRLLILIIVLFLFAYPVYAVTRATQLTWDASSGAVTGYRIYYGTSSGIYSGFKDVGSVTQYALSNLPFEEGIRYYIVVKAYNDIGESEPSNEVTYCCDSTVPVIVITSPTGSGSYSATSGTITISGTSSDNMEISDVIWEMVSGNLALSDTATGTTSWTVSGISLESGTNTFTVTASDCAGNTASKTLAIDYTVADSIAPVISITSPTSATSYGTTSSTIALAGNASDNVGVATVSWANAANGTSGTAEGKTAWSISGIALSEGTNTIAVTASDSAGNSASDTLSVTYTAEEAAAPGDTTAPSIAIISPTTDTTYSTTSGTITLSGTASDSIGVTKVTWSSSSGSSGTAIGTTSWSISGIALSEGLNTISVIASDSAGNSASDTLSVTYTALKDSTPSDTTAPSVAITSPTTDNRYSTTSGTITITGNAVDNVGVAKVTWTNATNGNSGAADGTTAWSISGISLSVGSNIITVRASDNAGNSAYQSLIVYYIATKDIPTDTIAPDVIIRKPTNRRSYSTKNNSVEMAGTASDNVAVTEVRWVNNSNGTSGTATGTTSWTISNIALKIGRNSITVTAYDAAGNSSKDRLSIRRRR